MVAIGPIKIYQQDLWIFTARSVDFPDAMLLRLPAKRLFGARKEPAKASPHAQLQEIIYNSNIIYIYITP